MSPQEDLLAVVHLLAELCDRLGLTYAFGGAIAQNFWGTVFLIYNGFHINFLFEN